MPLIFKLGSAAFCYLLSVKTAYCIDWVGYIRMVLFDIISRDIYQHISLSMTTEVFLAIDSDFLLDKNVKRFVGKALLIRRFIFLTERQESVASKVFDILRNLIGHLVSNGSFAS